MFKVRLNVLYTTKKLMSLTFWHIISGNPAATIGSGTVDCGSGLSNNNPDKGLRVCDQQGVITTSLQSGDM